MNGCTMAWTMMLHKYMYQPDFLCTVVKAPRAFDRGIRPENITIEAAPERHHVHSMCGNSCGRRSVGYMVGYSHICERP